MSKTSAPAQTSSAPTIANRYEARAAKDGVYDQLIEKISGHGTLCLGGADYNKEFVRKVTENGNYKYALANDDNQTPEDCHFIMFGQVCPMALGTQLSSRGNNVNYKVCTLKYHSNTL
jgi:hypothetical protein